MALFRATALFDYQSNQTGTGQGHRSGGWSESAYIDDTDTDIRARFRAFCMMRARMLANGSNIIGQRFQRVDPIGPTLIGAEGFPGNSRILVDIPQMAVRAQFFASGASNVRPWLFPGIPDNWAFEGEQNPEALIQGYLNNIATALANGFMFKTRDNRNQQYKILAIDDVGTVVMKEATPFVNGNQIQVLRSNTEEGNRRGGFATITAAVDNKHFTITPWAGGTTTGGTMRIAATRYVPFSSTPPILRFVTTRKIGKGFFGYRGKATRRR